MPKLFSYTFETEISFKGRVTVKASSHEDAVDLIEYDMEIKNSPLLHIQRDECWERAVQTINYVQD